MINIEFLRAVDFLPEVGAHILRQRDGVRTLMARANELRQHAALIGEQAVQAQRILERRVQKLWTNEEWNEAQRRGRVES